MEITGRACRLGLRAVRPPFTRQQRGDRLVRVQIPAAWHQVGARRASWWRRDIAAPHGGGRRIRGTGTDAQRGGGVTFPMERIWHRVSRLRATSTQPAQIYRGGPGASGCGVCAGASDECGV